MRWVYDLEIFASYMDYARTKFWHFCPSIFFNKKTHFKTKKKNITDTLKM